MNKEYVKSILITMRTADNEATVNSLLGKIDMIDDATFKQDIAKFGNNEEEVRAFLARKIQEKNSNQKVEKYPINDMFNYGISENCIHLHLPTDLHVSIAKNRLSKTMALVNLYLLDAIDKINDMKKKVLH